MIRCLGISLVILLGWASLSFAQGSLGSPVPRANPVDSQIEQPGPRASFPIFGPARGKFRPIRSVIGSLFPPPPAPAPNDEMPTPTRDEVTRMSSDGFHTQAEITAAKIKIEESQAKARCAAVKYLGTVDFHYYPEAETGLVSALRADRSESVRYEAALALGQLRSMTPRVMEALNVAALGVDTDGNPGESSERVRTAARQALERAAASMLGPDAFAQQPMMMPMPMDFSWYTPDLWALQQVGYQPPMPPAYDPNLMPRMTQERVHERAIAETVSAKPRPVTTPASQRSFREVVWSLLTGRFWMPAEPESADRVIAERMRGLRPLGSGLAIPSWPRYTPTSTMPYLPYNSGQ